MTMHMGKSMKGPAGPAGPLAPARPQVLALVLALAVAVVLALVFALPARALAADDGPAAAVELSGEANVSLARVAVVELPVSATPASIQTGVPCGMTEMCGQDPCLCGAVDAWGACACNGLEETVPAFSLACDEEGVVTLVSAFGRNYLVALGAGSTHARVTAELPHHEAASFDLQVEVAPFGLLDAAKLLAALLALAAVCAGAFLLVCAVVRAAGRLVRRMRGRDAEGNEDGRGAEE